MESLKDFLSFCVYVGTHVGACIYSCLGVSLHVCTKTDLNRKARTKEIKEGRRLSTMFIIPIV